jgi:sugar lactone lactonase YvrE
MHLPSFRAAPACLGVLVSVGLAGPAAAIRYRIDTFAGGGPVAADASVGDGLPATLATLDHPAGLARDRRGAIYVADHNHARVRRIRSAPGTRTITTVAGSGVPGFGGDDGPATDAELTLPTGVSVMRSGDLLIADAGSDAGGSTVRRVDVHGVIRTFAGIGDAPPGDSGDGGPAQAARLNTPLRTAIARNGDVYIVELNNNRVRVVRAATGLIEPVAGTGVAGNDGDDGPAVAARLNQPAGIVLSPQGTLYIADFGNHRIRVVGADGMIHAFAGTGVQTGSIDGEGGDPRDDLHDGAPVGVATFFKPTGIALDRHGALLVADQGNNRIRRIARDGTGQLGPGSVVTTIVGDGRPGFGGDGGDALQASLLIPTDVLPLPRGRLLIADRGNERVRIVVPVAAASLCSVGCGDGNPCTTDRCDPVAGCVHEPVPGSGPDGTCDRLRR